MNATKTNRGPRLRARSTDRKRRRLPIGLLRTIALQRALSRLHLFGL
jgi:hypothetical protein